MESAAPQFSEPVQSMQGIVDSPTLASQPGIANQIDQVQQTEERQVEEPMDVSQEQQDVAPPETKTPEPSVDQQTSAQKLLAEASPSTPGHLDVFDWDAFESRYEKALADANKNERELLEEFNSLVKYFNVWASASSAHDIERANKRLQTREKFVALKEQDLADKKRHRKSLPSLYLAFLAANTLTVTEVVRAFQSALALLSKT